MIPSKCKGLAEVDFPIAVVSKYAAREKSIRHGHPSTLHLWWMCSAGTDPSSTRRSRARKSSNRNASVSFTCTSG